MPSLTNLNLVGTGSNHNYQRAFPFMAVNFHLATIWSGHYSSLILRFGWLSGLPCLLRFYLEMSPSTTPLMLVLWIGNTFWLICYVIK